MGRVGHRTEVKRTNGTMALTKTPTSELAENVFEIRSQFSCTQTKWDMC
jgi:hypothetical protein